MKIPEPTTDKEKQELKNDILLDLYYYQKELNESNLRDEDKQLINEKIKDAENLYCSL